jgi:orotidine-5'-phosphate decarboxylase
VCLMSKFKNPVFCAIDTTALSVAGALAADVGDHVGGFKLGLEFFAVNGPQGIKKLSDTGLPVFLDLKLHDIPNTVSRAVAALMPLEPAIITIHAQGGSAMMKAARDAAHQTSQALGIRPPALVAVTVLTSLDDGDLTELGIDGAPAEQVLRLAGLAKKSGLDGIVCSPHEIAAVRAQQGPEFLLVVPGIRPQGVAKGDQKRVMTPLEAKAAGADVLVIGRPITGADNPRAAARAIAATLG